METIATMESINFEFLRSQRPELADLGGFAEQYVYADPESALVKLRLLGESIVSGIYSQLGLAKMPQMNFLEMLQDDQFRAIVPKVILDKFHFLRKTGNYAAHGGSVLASNAILALEEGYNLAKWLFLTVHKGSLAQCPGFQKPPPPSSYSTQDYAQLKKEGEQLRRKLVSQEVQMAKLLEDLEQARARVKERDEGAVQHMIAAGAGAINELNFDEATTRDRLIDAALVAAGWEVAAGIESTEQVGKEVELEHQPTPSGKGKADYVLYAENGLPLGVIEAKRTSQSEERGRKQAKDYADSLEKQYGQRPIIFYTNGFKTKIWNDLAGEPPRDIYGFYSRNSLSYLIQQRAKVEKTEFRPIKEGVVEREYQFEAIKRVCKTFDGKRRKALIVLATGTGKTRVSIALADLLIQAQWVKRVLFLCDRRELRKQAYNAFKEFIPSEPITIVNGASSKDQDSRIFLSTYPGMMKYYERFDVGFFNLIIADESHRSIYNRYRELFQYFDSLQVGLTATPVEKINRNTYELFGCQDRDPTTHYGYKEAVGEGYLTPFEVEVVTTGFLRKGMKYAEMTQEQQAEADEQEEDPTLIDYEQPEVDRAVMNKDTNRFILRNLMENGIKDASGNAPGKTIIFARNHNHALILQRVFEEEYPQYGGDFCRVIDNQEPRAEQLIDDFKGKDLAVEDERNKPRIAISVDMLDTGVDIPEVVNLVFAKPIKSYVKFWQMIGRGTRLCRDLFGPGKDKEKFLIFDHWKNFEWFQENYREREDSKQKSLLQQLFEARLELADEAIKKTDRATFELAVNLLSQDLADLPDKTIAVRDKYREIHAVKSEEVLKRMDAATKAVLVNDIAPLMQWRNIRGQFPAYRFDLLISRLQVENLRRTPRVDDLRASVLDLISRLSITINAVREKADFLKRVRQEEYWKDLSTEKLEELRKTIRGIAQYAEEKKSPPIPPKEIDITEDESQIERHNYVARFEGLELIAYRKRVREALEKLFDTDPVLLKIRTGKKVSPEELNSLCSLVLTQHPDVDLRVLREFYPETTDLQVAIRKVVGLDSEAVEAAFADFVKKHHATMGAKQMHFLRLLKNHISRYGDIEIDRLYEAPFTSIDSEGVDGVFAEEEQIEDLLNILDRFRPYVEQEGVTTTQ